MPTKLCRAWVMDGTLAMKRAVKKAYQCYLCGYSWRGKEKSRVICPNCKNDIET